MINVPASKSLLEAGECFIFTGLRGKGEILSEARKKASSYPMKVLTVFSISTSGNVTYRIDDCDNEMKVRDILRGDLPNRGFESTTTFSVRLTEAELMVEQGIWAVPEVMG